MKNLTFIIILAYFLASCSKEQQTSKNPDSQADSLTTNYGIDFDNKDNIILIKPIYFDSLQNKYFIGEMDKKAWIGIFDKSGKELITKLYTTDPSSMDAGYGESVELKKNRFFKAFEINDVVYITRFIEEDVRKGEFSPNAVQVVSEFNRDYVKLSDQYFYCNNKKPYLNKISYYNGGTLFLFLEYKGVGSEYSDVWLKGKNGEYIFKLEKSKTSKYRPSEQSTAIDNYDFIDTYLDPLVPNSIILQRRSFMLDSKTTWHKKVQYNHIDGDKVKIFNGSLINGEYTVSVEIIHFDGTSSTILIKANADTGAIMETKGL